MKLTKTTFFLGCLTGGIGAAFVPLLISSTQAETKLLPFQGRLTDAAGTGIPDGAKVVEFKLYDAPTGGNVKWAGEVHKLSINGGLVNTMLGSKASLGSVDFSTPCYLQITVDANADSQITAADPPLLPRQSVVAAVYAAVAGQMQFVIPAAGTAPAAVASAGWNAVFDNGRPDTGRISGEKLADVSVTTAKIASGAVTTAKLASGVGQPVGSVFAYAGIVGAIPPDGYLWCNGSVVSENTYGALFLAVGSTYNIGNEGAGNFRLPDLSGRTPIGAGEGVDLTNRVLGQKLGEETHKLTIAEMPYHAHTGFTTQPESPALGRVAERFGATYNLYGRTAPPFLGHTFVEGTFTMGIPGEGGDGRHNVMQPSLVLNYLIKY